ncbi:heavy-metal-associated domain-containing protein [uncultured Castellaniella sp.]|jgi:Cu+-exporting ATPase|uniref:heavy-metal-associated domain-containing protein n=1 Tax=uncultured Castellaniella sp. TaxID=647907 RepID=UPI002604A8D5|nr:heavy-metal-associated domain-containing protein [uncultured Castellaniella sp.]
MQAETLKRSSQKTETMRLVGLRGPDCADKLDRVLAAIPGVSQVSVSLADEKATVTFDTAQVSTQRLQVAVADAGYEALKPVHGQDGNCCGGCGG